MGLTRVIGWDNSTHTVYKTVRRKKREEREKREERREKREREAERRDDLLVHVPDMTSFYILV